MKYIKPETGKINSPKSTTNHAAAGALRKLDRSAANCEISSARVASRCATLRATSSRGSLRQALSGDRESAERSLRTLAESGEQAYLSPYDVALVYAGLGRSEDALDWLERARAERNGWLVFLNVEPRFKALRRHRRFVALVETAGFA